MGRVSLVRVFSGTLRAESPLHVTGRAAHRWRDPVLVRAGLCLLRGPPRPGHRRPPPRCLHPDDYLIDKIHGVPGPCRPANRDADDSLEKVDNCRLSKWAYDRRALEPAVPLIYLAAHNPADRGDVADDKYRRAFVGRCRPACGRWSVLRTTWTRPTRSWSSTTSRRSSGSPGELDGVRRCGRNGGDRSRARISASLRPSCRRAWPKPNRAIASACRSSGGL